MKNRIAVSINVDTSLSNRKGIFNILKENIKAMNRLSIIIREIKSKLVLPITDISNMVREGIMIIIIRYSSLDLNSDFFW